MTPRIPMSTQSVKGQSNVPGRLEGLSASRSRRRFAPLATLLLALAGVGSSCGHARPPEARDAPFVEVLRLKISKVRHAIEETRQAIALSRGTEYLPELYLRLGELLSEEARYHYQVAFEREQRTSEALHVPQVRLLKEQAIGVYEQILRDYPQAGNADRVLFNIAQERRELGQFDNPTDDRDMVGALTRLVNDFPQSQFRFEALLVLGDYHFDRSQLAESKRFYERITASPELTSVSDLAHYKLAWVWVNMDNCEKALDEFEAAIRASRTLHGEAETERATDAPTVAQSVRDEESLNNARSSNQGIDVRRAAITDLAYCYAQERTPDGVLAFMRGLAHDRSTYIAGLDRIALRYSTTNEANGLLTVSRELLRLAASDEIRLDNARSLHTAIRRRNTYLGIGEDVTLMIDALNRFVTRVSVTDEARTRTVNEFEVYARDLLTRAQTALERVPEARRTEVANDLALGYDAYLATFTTGDNVKDMLLNSAGVLGTAHRDFEAGVRDMQAADMLPEGQGQQEALYDAVVHFQAAMDATTARTHIQRVVTRSQLRRAGSQLLRYEIPAEQERRVKLAVATTYYDEGDYRDAIDRLTALAYEFPQSREAEASINLVLDSYNTLNDYEGLQRACARFLAEGSPATAELRAQIQPIAQAAEQRMLDEVSLEAAGDEGGNIQPLVEFAAAHEGSDLGERALLNAFVAARAIGDTTKLYQLGEQISHDYPRSTQLPGILATLGQTAIARFEYSRAVGLLRQAAQADESQRVRLLVAAGDLSEQLGDTANARTNFEEAIRAAGDNAQAAAVPLQRYATFIEHQGNAEQTLSALQAYASNGGPDVSAVIGLAQAALGRTQEAEGTLQSVLSAGASASPDALARAHLGMGEVLLATVTGYPQIDTADAMQEYITVVDVTQQSYLSSVQQGNPEVGAVALSRLASLALAAANRLRSVHLSGLSADEQQLVNEAIQQRVTALEQTAREALSACADQAWNVPKFSPTVRACLRGQAASDARMAFDPVRARNASSMPSGIEELQSRISRNPDDLEGLRDLGMRFLQQGDAQSARLVFAAAVDKGGGPVELNLLGIASARAGDVGGALEAFAKAAQGGLEVGRQNLAAYLREQGLQEASRTALTRYPAGRPGGLSLSEAGSSRGGRQ